MKRFAKSLAVLFAAILAISVFAFAAETEEEKTYIVYPKFTLFTASDNPAGFYVVTQEELDMLLEDDLVESYRETVKGVLLENEESVEPNWDIKAVNAFSVPDKYTGEGIKIGIIDSGIDHTHSNFLVCDDGQPKYTRVLPGTNYLTGKSGFIEKVVDGKTIIESTTKDLLGHGTMVAGKAAAQMHAKIILNGNTYLNYGVSGVAPLATIVPLKVTDTKSVDDVYVTNAIYGAVDDYDCDVINISIGFYNRTEEEKKAIEDMKKAIDYAVGKGVTVVASVGNDGTGTLMYPAAFDNVIGVGATDNDGNVWVNVDPKGGSQQNESVFITAPGAGIISTWSYDALVKNENGEMVSVGFNSMKGTSFSAPLVTGTVALLKQANTNLTPAEIMNILAESATDDANGDGYDTAYGHGILDVEAALKLVLDESRAPSTVTYRVTADDELLSGAVMVANYTVGNIGSHPLGEIFTAKAEPTVKIGNDTYKFAYWANGNGTYVSGETPYTFIATSNFTLRAVYDKDVAGELATTEKKVEFWNGNGILLGTADVDTTTGTVDSIPEKAQNPTMTGYAFDSWLDEDKNAFTADSILKKNFTRVVAQFKDKETMYSITFDDEADSTENGAYGKKVTYEATNIENFDYWKLGNKIVSYNPSVEIALWGADKKLTAVYDAENFDVEPTVVLDTGADEANFLIYSVPDDYKIVDAGIVFGKSGENPRVASFRSKASVKKLPENGFGQFTSLPGDASHVVARGYLIYKDANNVIRVIYSN